MMYSTPDLVGTRIAQLEREAAETRLGQIARKHRTARRPETSTGHHARPFGGLLGRILAVR
jgi:hypothetical protein